ncbi:MAG TPA: lytic transglycosylase domain-containing protein [Acidimicrobiales bacterium]|nr:lytic transglycosylase domain-containing protein [Acidimicrobiales bacterium]
MTPLRVLVGAVLGLVAITGIAVGALGAVVGGAAPTGAAGPAPPAAMTALYRAAAATCPGLPAAVLAAIGTIESDNGASTLPGVHSDANPAGAEGPMQFEAATFAEYALPVPPGGADPPTPYDPVDAVYAAARLLCANGAAGGRDLADAIFSYNHSSDYVRAVLALAGQGF